MTVEDTAPIAPQAPAVRRVDPWKILACVSTVLSVATIATLVWTVNKVGDDDPTPTERMSTAAGVTTSVIQEPAPAAPAPAPAPAAPVAQTAQAAPAASAPSAPVTRTSDTVVGDSSLQRFFPMQAGAPLPPAGQWPAPGGLPPVNFASLPTPNINVNPGFSIDAIIAAVSGTAGWLGGGTLNLLGDIIVADAMNNGGGPQPQWPRELDVTKIPPPQWPRELDVTKIPPPQWPRELDVTKIPPPHVHWDRMLPRF